MSQDTQQQILDTLREVRDGQRKIIALLAAQQTLAEEQVKRSRATVEESVGLQRLAVQRQRTAMLVALPAILVCIGAIAFLILRYF